jgi:hypothetical protein
VFSAIDFLRRSIFSSRTSSVKLSTLPLPYLIGPVADLPGSFRMEETLAAWNGRHGDAEVDGKVCRMRTRFRPEALVMIETRPGDRHLAKLALGTEL